MGHRVNLKWREASDANWRQGENNVERILRRMLPRISIFLNSAMALIGWDR
jgi:hypothetical protein